MLKILSFPSVNFPGADLRVSENTAYSFRCPSCTEIAEVDFSWILRWENPEADLEADILKEAYELFSYKSGTYFEPAKCPSCEKMFVVYIHIDETLNNAFRVKILGVAEVV